MKVRAGTPADVPRALEIWRAAVDATHLFLATEHRAKLERIVSQQFLPAAELWLAVDGRDVPMGFLVMDGDKIDALFVDPAVHGRGYGSMLVEHARTLAPAPRVDANEQASNALPFYLARGFSVAGRSPIDGMGWPYPLVHLVSRG